MLGSLKCHFVVIAGHTINKLTKHNDKDVRELAAKLVKEWKDHFTEKMDRPMIEVKSCQKTEKIRKTGRKLLAGALEVPVSIFCILCNISMTPVLMNLKDVAFHGE